MLYLILVSNTEYTEIAVVLNLAFLLTIVYWNCFCTDSFICGDDTNWPCSMYGRDEKCIQNLNCETWR